MLYQFGLVQFTVYPFNVSEVEHTTGTDWARKEIAGASIYREWVGEAEEEITLKGKVFPHFFFRHSSRSGQARSRFEGFGGLGWLDLLDNTRRLGQAHLLQRGDGIKLGWFVIDKLSRGHQHLGADGIGQQIDFQATFQRVPVPDPTFYYSSTLLYVP